MEAKLMLKRLGQLFSYRASLIFKTELVSGTLRRTRASSEEIPMKSFIKLCLVVATCAGTFAQNAPEQTTNAATTPAAFVYVSAKGGVYGFSAAANGKLTPVAGSPFKGQLTGMAVNGKYLFGAGAGFVNIFSYSIAANGVLKQVSSINAQKFTADNCGAVFPPLFLDHTGADLYALSFDNDCANNAYQFFKVNQSTGQLTYFGVTSASSPDFETGLTITANNVFAYGAAPFHFDSAIYGFKRASNGDLTHLSFTFNSPIPAAKSGSFYLTYLAAADTTNHFAVSLQPISDISFGATGPTQLATYTVASSGMLSTSSTYKNMPAVAVGEVNYLKMAPSGKLLAVAGSGGLQVFHFNGASPITKFTGQLTKTPIDQCFWDNANHLYAISDSAGKLFVFTVTTTSASQAVGSPYSIGSPRNIIVQPK
jgi:hypothetical protein